MYAPMTPTTERTRIRSEREYREWQLSLRGYAPVKRFKDQPSALSRVANTIRRALARRPHATAELRHTEQHV